jgi:hypothetical protein
MRIWSLHPKYLDAKGLVALWRETLLAKNVLAGQTKGYKNHPQLERFKYGNKSVTLINNYLEIVHQESKERQYNFDKSKFSVSKSKLYIPVTDAQIQYEFEHLLKKLKVRDHERYKKLKNLSSIHTHPLFFITKGDIEIWERQ